MNDMFEVIHTSGCKKVAFYLAERPESHTPLKWYSPTKPDGTSQDPHTLAKCANCGQIVPNGDFYTP